MKPCYLHVLFLLLVLLSSCDKRTCVCEDDVTFTTDLSDPLSMIVSLPNAVYIESDNLQIDIWSEEEVDFQNQQLRLSKDDEVLLEATDLTPYLEEGRYLVFPTLEMQDGTPATGAVDIDFEFSDTSNGKVSGSGSIFFYTCEDYNQDFDLSDCRWPSQLRQPLFNDPGPFFIWEPC